MLKKKHERLRSLENKNRRTWKLHGWWAQPAEPWPQNLFLSFGAMWNSYYKDITERKFQVRTRQLEHHWHLNVCPKKKDGLSFISLQGWNASEILMCWKMFTLRVLNAIHFFLKMCQEMLIFLAFRSDGASYRFVSTSSNYYKEITERKFQVRTRQLEHHWRLNKCPKKKEGLSVIIACKGGTLLRSWCVEKCLPFSC